jgi:tetratricopeptide (TPR) repeat protein
MLTRAILLTAVLIAAGCGDQVTPARRVDAQSAADQAKQATVQKDYAAAEAAWTKAVSAGTLDPDQLVNAMIQRAVCRARLKKFNDALADLDSIKDVTPNLDEYHVARSFVLRAQGNSGQAQAEFAKARRLNPSIQPLND